MTELVEQALAGTDMQALDVKIRVESGRRFLTVYLDRVGGRIGLDDCERVSEELSLLLDAADVIAGRYYLEVSSPGVARPLTKPEHFQRFLGERAKIKAHTPINGARSFTGTIAAVHEGRVLLTLADREGVQVEIPFDDIARANLEPDLMFRPKKRQST
ncbi:MAG: ribosome maturation factor RimP [Candidatus Schekmanbacteria bacterium]|nr:ribosome maturation factor RimP [Candidatus Schekmanbacteria bacterium]